MVASLACKTDIPINTTILSGFPYSKSLMQIICATMPYHEIVVKYRSLLYVTRVVVDL